MICRFVHPRQVILLVSEGDMTICSPEAGNIARAILPDSGEQIIMSPSRATIVYYTEPLLKQISDMPHDKRM